jgi:hypothetical protein
MLGVNLKVYIQILAVICGLPNFLYVISKLDVAPLSQRMPCLLLFCQCSEVVLFAKGR